MPDAGANLLDGDVGVLCGDHDGIDAPRLAVHVLHADLRLPVRAQEIQESRPAHFAQTAHQLVRQHDGQRHQFRRLVAGKAEHQPLVARAAGIHAHGDVARLVLEDVDHAAGPAVETKAGIVVADFVDGPAGDLLDVQPALRAGCDLPGHDAQPGGYQDLAGHAAHWVVLHHGIQNGVRNLVRDLVGVPFGHRFGRKDKLAGVCHLILLL